MGVLPATPPIDKQITTAEARLEAENERLRELVAALRRQSAEDRDFMRQEMRRCSHS